MPPIPCGIDPMASAGLPAGYVRVKGVMTVGNVHQHPYTHIRTDYFPNNKTRMELDMTGNGYINQGLFGTSGYWGWCRIDAASVEFRCGSVTKTTGAIDWPSGERRLVVFDSPTATYYDGKSTVTGVVVPSFVVSRPFPFFCRWDNGTLSYGCNYTLFGATFYEDGEIVRKYVPCVRLSDGEAGLYELKTKTFLSSYDQNYHLIAVE